MLRRTFLKGLVSGVAAVLAPIASPKSQEGGGLRLGSVPGGPFGGLWPAQIPKAPKPLKGGFSVREDVTVLPADNPNPRLGWVIYEEVGVVVNDYKINKVTLDRPPVKI